MEALDLSHFITGKLSKYELYCSLFPCEESKQSNCKLDCVGEECIRVQATEISVTVMLTSKGSFYKGGECILFPSKDNRDWSTFKAPQEERPKFKIGEVVGCNNDYDVQLLGIVSGYVEDNGTKISFFDPIDDIEKEFDATVLHLATPEEITKWNKEVLEPNHMHYDGEKRKIVHWFLPFDKVVVKFDDDKSTCWQVNLFSHYDKDGNSHYICVDSPYLQCLPYNEQTAKLIGTFNNYKEDKTDA